MYAVYSYSCTLYDTAVLLGMEFSSASSGRFYRYGLNDILCDLKSTSLRDQSDRRISITVVNMKYFSHICSIQILIY
jgi:hypothetical protein